MEQNLTASIFWERVKFLIKQNRTTQKNAAAACTVSLRTFQNWMYKNLYPTIVDGYHLARFLGVSVDYLVTGHERKTQKQIDTARTLLKKADENLDRIRA